MSEHFFQLLRYSIGAVDEFPEDISSEEWGEIHEMALRQSLLGVIFYGIQKKSSARPERKLLLQWYALNERIRQRNQQLNQVAVDLSGFFLKEGFRTCILKGQGNTLNYPEPYIRTSGDIDIWVDGGTTVVLAFVRKMFSCSKAIYHHVDVGKYKGMEVEVHYRPSFMNNLFCDYRMQRWFEQVSKEQFSHQVELPDGAGRICVPTHAFNRIYQMAHINNHVIHEGIGLRQLVDYYFVLKQGFTEEERVEDEMLLRKFGLYKVASAVMYVLRVVLHLEDELMIVPADERLGRFLLDEIMLAGNFGHYDDRVRHDGSRLAKNIQRMRRDMRLVWYFPSECLWEPVFRIYHFFWRLRHK